MTIPAEEQEESVRCALNIQAIVQSLGPQAHREGQAIT